jgi:hypothetical protein
MKRLILLAASILMLLATQQANAYDFSAINDDGKIIYYNITSPTPPLTVEVTHNGDGTYSGEIAIPDSVANGGNIYSVTAIGKKAFSFCYFGLTSVIIPHSVTTIGEEAFFNCRGLTSITIPNSVTSIEDKAFSNCRRLTSITIPNSVITIGMEAFYLCSELISVMIGNSVTTIGDGAFAGCSCLTSITIPNSVITIGDHAFASCYGLTSVTIPNSVTSIGREAFEYCSGLTEVYVKAEVPPSIGVDAFWGVSRIFTLYVPCGKKTAYQNVTGWSYYATSIVDNIPFEITTQSNDTEMGTAKITAPNTCANNNTAVIAAIAYTGYRFLQWNDGNTENPRTVTVTQNTTFTATFGVETGITDIEASALSLYPNPATDNISIVLPENVFHALFTLYDMQGKVLIKQEVSSKETIAVNKLASGIYIYNVRTDKQNYQGKLIRK